MSTPRDPEKQKYYMKRYYSKKEYIKCDIQGCIYKTKRNTDLNRHKKTAHEKLTNIKTL
jgi:hypothetical protein